MGLYLFHQFKLALDFEELFLEVGVAFLIGLPTLATLS